MSLLEVKNLTLSIRQKPILKNLSFNLERGKITALVGESGSGKSLTALSIMKLLPPNSRATGGINFQGNDLLSASEDQMCALRGDDIGMVFQEPMTALNPLKTIGEQVAEGIRIHAGVDRSQAMERAAAILAKVGLPQDQYALSRYPHELSGGQRQRVVIAIACAMKPKLLIADEPTTALDVIVQARILELLKDLVAENDMALLLISHDLGVVADVADNIVIMRQGEIVEQGNAIKILREENHPYTRQLARASQHIPKKNHLIDVEQAPELVSVENLTCQYKGKRTSLFRAPPPFVAVDNVSFQIKRGEILGLVGESGCGKSTLSRCLLGLIKPATGSISFDQQEVSNRQTISRQSVVEFAQAVFQDPYGSFNPRHRAERLVTEPLFLKTELHHKEKHHLAVEALERVGLSSRDLEKYPHEFSGGQRQRLAIARAIVNKPKLIVADEPVSALDVSIRAQILDLIIELREQLDMTWLFVSHDLSVVRALCDRVMIMKGGKIIEYGKVADIYDNPINDYTRELIEAAPDLSTAIAKKA